MKVSVIYTAYDGTHFESPLECKEYEDKARELIKEANEVFRFYDKNARDIKPPIVCTIEDWLAWFYDAVDKCETICIMQTRSEELKYFLNYNVPCYLQDLEEVGLYTYNYIESEWVRID